MTTEPGQDNLVQRTLATILDLGNKSREYGASPLTGSLDELTSKLASREYTVLVAGEAKRGKSTFVNALIGRSLLPTDIDIATSQVFRVRSSEHESCRVRYEDESSEEIAATELAQYGTQSGEDSTTFGGNHRVVRWIEVDVPTLHVPEGIILLDTPGLGSLYGTHAQVTYRFVPRADAVIFVLDSEQPVIQAELDFIERILQETPNIFFVQTKIDLFSTEHWEAIRQRSLDTLNQHFADRLGQIEIAPVSSVNLQRATEAGSEVDREVLLLVSRHEQMVAALHDFLLREVATRTALEALLLASSHHASNEPLLRSRLGSLDRRVSGTESEAVELANQNLKEFESGWGPGGERRRKLLVQLEHEVEAGRLAFRQAIDPDGQIMNSIDRHLDRMRTTEGLRELGKAMPAEVAERVARAWRDARAGAEQRCARVLASFLLEAETITIAVSDPVVRPKGPGFSRPESEELLRRIREIESHISPFVTKGTLMLITGAVLNAHPVGWAITIGLAFSMVKSIQISNRDILDEMRAEVRAVARREIRAQFEMFTHLDPYSGEPGLADRQFQAMTAELHARVDAIVIDRISAARSEVERQRSELQLRDSERESRREDRRRQLAEWERLGRELQLLIEQLTATARPLTSGAAIAS